MMKVIVSACLAGDNCKYNGGKNITKEFSHGAQLAFEIVQKENPGPRPFCRALH